MSDVLLPIGPREALSKIVSAVDAAWPEHQKFLTRSLSVHSPSDLNILEGVAGDILRLCGDRLAEYVDFYRWMCDVFRREGMYFKRTGRYRHSAVSAVATTVYNDRVYMEKYMGGLLLSQVLWANHAKSAIYFIDGFLKSLPKTHQYLEIGPGHGLFLANAARHAHIEFLTAWDISRESIHQASSAIAQLQVKRNVRFEERDVLDCGEISSRFDVVVVSEVLEHMENPGDALLSLRQVITNDGYLFINFPINSPAPDHIFLLETVEDVVRMVASCGFRPIDTVAVPMTGYTLSEALSNRATVSCLITARVDG